MLQRYYRMDPSADNYPPGYRAGRDNHASYTAPDSPEKFFIRQERVSNSYFSADALPNITRTARPPLLVSNDDKMAIEECVHGAEAKNYFATRDLVDAANLALRGHVRLKTTNRFLGLRHQALYEVAPVVVTATREHHGSGENMRTPQKCNLMAQFLTDLRLNPAPGRQLLFHLAAAIDKVTDYWYYPGRRTTLHPELVSAYHARAGSRKGYEAKQQEVEQRFYEMTEELVGGPLLKDALDETGLGLLPQLGQAIVIWPAASDAQAKKATDSGINVFPYHFATVVASSGDDYVTLENYERFEGSDVSDPLFFFQMYSTSMARPEQSWQRRQATTPGIIGLPVSFQWSQSDYAG